MDDAIRQEILKAVNEKQGTTLTELLCKVEDAQNGHVFELILTKEVFVDLDRAFLGDEDEVQVFSSRPAADFFYHLAEMCPKEDKKLPRASDLILNSTLLWDGVPVELINIGKTEVCLKRAVGDFPRMPIFEFEKQIREGVITEYQLRPQIDPEHKAYELAVRRKLNDKQLVETLEKEKIVLRILNGEQVGKNDNERRKYRYWVVDYKESEAKCGNGLVGLMPKPRKGNTTDRLALIHPQLRSWMGEYIEEHENPTNIEFAVLYGGLGPFLRSKGINNYVPSDKVFRIEIKQRESSERTRKIKGSKVAYQEEEQNENEYTTPVEGDRVWQYAHIDHTLMDIYLLHSEKMIHLGKAWITLMIDSKSREILAHYISFDPPSTVSCICVVRECVRRHGRVPECVVVDRGSEFRGGGFKTLCAKYHCDVQWRPPTKPRFGAIIERFFHTLNKQFFHNLRGNTKIMKRAREVTKEVNPQNLAIWDLPSIDEALESYLYEEYNNREHSSLGRSPNDEFKENLRKFHVPEDEWRVEYDENFLIETMVSPRKPMHKIKRSRGIKAFGTWYKNNKLKKSSLYDTMVEVKLDPFDASHVYAYVKGEWIECRASGRLRALLRDKSIRMMKVISLEEREKAKAYGRKAKLRYEDLALGHSKREETEREKEQRLKDEERAKIAERKRKSCLRLVTNEPDVEDMAADSFEEDDSSTESVDYSSSRTFRRMRRG